MQFIKMAPAAIGLLFATATAIVGQDASPDLDGDGMVTMEEFVAAYPDLTDEAFIAADANADGVLDETEIAAAAEAGVLPMSET